MTEISDKNGVIFFNFSKRISNTASIPFLSLEAKSSDDSDPEKEAFDNAEKGEKAPIVEAEGGDKPAVDPTAAGDMANNSSPEKKAAPAVVEAESETKDSEDKKSNGGARTPV